MTGPREPGALETLQAEIESFLRSLRHPVLVEDEQEILDLTAAEWRVSVQFGKLLFEAWNPARSLSRRIEEVAYRDHDRLGLFVHRAGAGGAATAEFRELTRPAAADRARARGSFRAKLLAALAKEYSGWKFERVATSSDREHSFSAWYTRGVARRGTTAWAFLGLSEQEPRAADDSALAFGLIWLDWLRARSERVTIPGLKLFLPPRAIPPNAARAACLDSRALNLEICEWTPELSRPKPVDLTLFRRVEARLVPYRVSEELLQRHEPLVRELLSEYFGKVDVVADGLCNALSLRVLGLEVARIEGLLSPRCFFGLEGSYRRLDPRAPQEFRQFVARVLAERRPDPPHPSSEYYRLQSERWLEALLLRDPSRIDPRLAPEPLYPQVPAFGGGERGIIDLLGVLRDGRLAVIELKLEEEINLPFQGLDYWMRVRRVLEENRLAESGYFSGLRLQPSPPLLYFVGPAFRFHPTGERIVRYFDPALEMIQVGVNEQWRRGVRALFRRPMRPEKPGRRTRAG